jgi:asparagine synthase (glutamine-hydrolysing)
MCGIAGLFDRTTTEIPKRPVEAMLAALLHRGPDGVGQLDAPGVSIGNTRLAIIDLAGGDQPMSTADGRFSVVFNGEIFNASTLRSELIGRGRRFRTTCDTEVVLEAYAMWGEAAFDRLNGMWAVAIWDAVDRSLLLCRDRLGVKPLVWAQSGGRLAFSSEIRSLLASGLIERELDFEALPFYLASFAAPDPLTFLKGVHRLEAGCLLRADRHGVRQRRYWDCADVAEEFGRSEEEWLDEIDGLLVDSVQLQLTSDVPVGVLLSSGIDSAVVAAIASRAAPLSTFTLGFGGTADERQAAAEIALELRSKHFDAKVTPSVAAAALPDLLVAHGEPAQSLIQNNFVAELAAQRVKVALSGVGGDELFAAYPTHQLAWALSVFDQLPGPIRQGLRLTAQAAPFARAKRLEALTQMSPSDRVAKRLLHEVPPEHASSLIASDLRAELDFGAPATRFAELWSRPGSLSDLNRLLYVYIKSYLSDELLRTLDTMSMRHSLEARVPLLDHRLVERALAAPPDMKLRWTGERKVLLRRVALRHLPDGLVTRRKRGFSLPLNHWLRTDLREVARDAVSSAVTRKRGVFNPERLEREFESFLRGDARSTQVIAMAMSFELWAARVLDERPAPVASGPPVVVRRSSDRPRVSVVIVSWNTRAEVRLCLESLRQHLHAPHEVIVVDNDSHDGTADMVESCFPDVVLIRNQVNVGFGTACNQGMRTATAPRFLLLNSDAYLIDDSVDRLLKRLERDGEGIGIAHCRLEFPDGRLQHSTYRFPGLAIAALEDFGVYKLLSRERQGELLLAGYWNHDSERDVDAVAGAFMLVSRDCFESTGGFDERIFMYGEDIEWCRRVTDAGFRVRYFPQARVVHADHVSSAARWSEEGRLELCLVRERDLVRSREGELTALTFGGVRAIGAGLRWAYFTARSARNSDKTDYEPLRRNARVISRILVRLLRQQFAGLLRRSAP